MSERVLRIEGLSARVGALECWKHGSLFDLETGEALTLPALKPVAVHLAVIDGDDVLVELAPELGQ